MSVETEWRVKVTESIADKAAPAVVQPRLVRSWLSISAALHDCGVPGHVGLAALPLQEFADTR